MRFTPWATRMVLTLSLTATAFLTACGSGGSGSNTQVRLLNATRSYAALDLTVNDKTINSKIAYATVGDYGTVDTNNTATKVLTSDVGTSVAATTPTLSSGSNYTYITYGFAGAIRTTLLQEAQTAPDANKASLLVLNLAPDAGAMDIYLTSAADCSLTTETALTTNLAGGAGSGYIQINSGTFRVCVTGYNNRSDLRLNIPAITLGSASVNSLILTATDGGVLVNGITLVQKGAAQNFPNTQSRVRTVAALTNGSTVTSSINGQAMFGSTAISPLISPYVTTASGASTLSVNVDGLGMSFTPPTLTAGGDYTLLVWGDASAPKMSVLSDDNRLPTVNGNVKIRLVNALPTLTSSLNVDFSALAANVSPGMSSTPASISSTTSSQVDVTVPTSAASIYTKSDLAFPANSVWTFFAVPTTSTASTTTTLMPVPGMGALPKRERP
ncbi:DUF4397 domain-containing protein [Roseateles saccharophilus]|uniref:Uncharacterized protein DUF4397 n=1 Tax=Roseateles saccharophilus TaxID=304 RepID=A0A4R3UML7_ROSSA|nr:DUF4397 domain-containing protein [Roseateles saccharophilus]MDG0834251.1 DUF4397 domain-containing protein [Roseateles saccharophilus]TCU91861.1 uncharacterized protein DUF4397 [Roseateles saccharophilus]